MQTEQGNCALAWINEQGESVTESQYRILKAAHCTPGTPALEKSSDHHDLVARGVKIMISENRNIHSSTGTLGSRHGIRYRAHEKIKNHLGHIEGELFDTAELRAALQQMCENPLTEKAKAVLGQHLKMKSSAQALAECVQSFYQDDELCLDRHRSADAEPRLICSLGLQPVQTAGQRLSPDTTDPSDLPHNKKKAP